MSHTHTEYHIKITGNGANPVQRFGNALNLNIHFRMLFLDGVFTNTKHGPATFVRTKAPTCDELNKLVHTISHRVARYLERQGLLISGVR